MSPEAAQAVQLALADLPGWVRFGPYVLAGPTTFFVVVVSSWLAVAVARLGAPALTRGASVHWTEQARLIWPQRQALGYVLLTNVIWAVILGFGAGRGWSPGSVVGLVALSLVALVAGLGVGGASVSRQMGWPRRPLLERVRGAVAWPLLVVPHLFVAFALAIALPGTPQALLAATVGLSGLVVLVLRGDHAALLVWLGFLDGTDEEPRGARLAAAVASAAARAGHPAPRAVIVSRDVANAAAFPLGNVVLYTSRALDVLTPAELEAITLHELAHLHEPRAVRMGRLLRTVGATLLIALAWPLLSAGHAVAALVLLVGVGVLVLATRGIARRMEVRADATGHGHEADPGGYAAALERLYEANAVPAVLGPGRRAHPDLYDRLVAVGAPPTWPRPQRPPRLPAFAGGLVAVLVGIVAWGAVFVALLGAQFVEGPRVGAEVRLAVGVRRASVFDRLAGAWLAEGEPLAAARAVQAAMALEPDSPLAPARYALRLAERGACLDAARALRIASAVSAEGAATGNETDEDAAVGLGARLAWPRDRVAHEEILADAAAAVAACLSEDPAGIEGQGGR